MDLGSGEATTIAVLLAAVAPVTTLIYKLSEVLLKFLAHRHEVGRARTEQLHAITTQYLDRALSPSTPLAIRNALLRFLATPAKPEQRLQMWAKTELELIGPLVNPIEKQLEHAYAAVNAATNPAALQAAQRNLRLAQEKYHDLLNPPPDDHEVTPEAIRAGFFANSRIGGKKSLSGLDMRATDLRAAKLQFCDLFAANFSGSDLVGATFQGSNLRASVFSKTTLVDGFFTDADCRGATFEDADLRGSVFHSARLEGANMKAARIGGMRLKGAVYDEATLWPDGFDAEEYGAVLVPKNRAHQEVSSSEGDASKEVGTAAADPDALDDEGEATRSLGADPVDEAYEDGSEAVKNDPAGAQRDRAASITVVTS